MDEVAWNLIAVLRGNRYTSVEEACPFADSKKRGSKGFVSKTRNEQGHYYE